jgi:hypothetical protein
MRQLAPHTGTSIAVERLVSLLLVLVRALVPESTTFTLVILHEG